MTGEESEVSEQFVNFFEEKLEAIERIEEDGSPLFKKILCTSFLDALSRSVFPGARNRERFTSFVSSFADWPDGRRYSLLHLMRFFEIKPDPAFERLRLWVGERLGGWDTGRRIAIGDDPLPEELGASWPRSQEVTVPTGGVNLEWFQHFQLLYAYRNSLVHEFRERGFGMELPADGDPFYQFVSELDPSAPRPLNNRGRWELVYPLGFFLSLCRNPWTIWASTYRRTG